MTTRNQKRTEPTDPVTVRRFFELWREWLLETKEADWQDGSHIEEYKLILSMPFDEWWEKNKRRAAGIGYAEYAFIPINTVDDFNEYSGGEDIDERIFMIGFSTPKHILHEELDKLIDQYHTTYPPGDKSFFLNGIRSVAWTKRPIKRTVDALELILKVHQKVKENPDTSPLDMAIALGIRGEYGFRLEDGYKAEDDEGNDLPDREAEIEMLKVTAYRYIKWAKRILHFLNSGEFPNYKDKFEGEKKGHQM